MSSKNVLGLEFNCHEVDTNIELVFGEDLTISEAELRVLQLNQAIASAQYMQNTAARYEMEAAERDEADLQKELDQHIKEAFDGVDDPKKMSKKIQTLQYAAFRAAANFNATKTGVSILIDSHSLSSGKTSVGLRLSGVLHTFEGAENPAEIIKDRFMKFLTGELEKMGAKLNVEGHKITIVNYEPQPSQKSEANSRPSAFVHP